MDPEQRIWQERGLRDAVLAGDDAAWRVLYERCFESLYAYVHYRTGRQVSRTEDVVQECWLVAVRRIRHFDPARGSFESWLRGIADNVLRNYRRRWKRQQSREQSRTKELESAESAQSGADTGQQLELAEQIALTLTVLPAHYQQVLRAKYEQQLSVAEIAHRWCQTPKAVESLLSRARAAFRRAYSNLDKE